MVDIRTADRVAVKVVKNGDGNWQVTGTSTGFFGITSALFADGQYIHGYVVFENGSDFEIYDTAGSDASTLLQILNVTGTVIIQRPATPFASTNGGNRVTDDTGTHTLAIQLGAGTLARLLRETNPSWKTLNAADSTPDVSKFKLFVTAGTTPITRFDEMENGKIFYVRRGTDDIEIQSSPNISLSDSISITLTERAPIAIFVENSGTASLISHSADTTLFPNNSGATELTVASGAIALTQASHTLKTSSGAEETITSVNMDSFPVGGVSRCSATSDESFILENGTTFVTETGENITVTGNRIVVFTKLAGRVVASLYASQETTSGGPVPTVSESEVASENVESIQSYVNTSQDISLKPNQYELDSAIDVTNNGFSAIGFGPLRASAFSDGMQTQFTQTTDAEQIFHVQDGEDFVLYGTMLRHSGTRQAPLVQLEPTDGNADVDAKFVECGTIGDNQTATPLFQIDGRGFEARGCIFSQGGADVIHHLWSPAVREVEAGDAKGPILGPRNIKIRQTDIHGASLLLFKNNVTDGANTVGAIFADMVADAGGEFIDAKLNSSGIFGAVGNFANTQPFIFRGGTQSVVASGLSINGAYSIPARRPNHMASIHIGENESVDAVAFNGFSAQWIERELVGAFGTNQSTSILNGLSVTGGTCREMGTQGVARSLVTIGNSTVNGMLVDGIIFRPHSDNPATKLISTTNVAWASGKYPVVGAVDMPLGMELGVPAVIAGNQFTGIVDELATTGFIKLRRANSDVIALGSSGRLGIGTGSDALARKMVVRDTRSIVADFQRNSLSGGAGFLMSGLNTASEFTPWAFIFASYLNATDGSEEGYTGVAVQNAGALPQVAHFFLGSDRSGTLSVGNGITADQDVSIHASRGIASGAFTIGTLPNAATLPPGTRVWVSDVECYAISNGADWCTPEGSAIPVSTGTLADESISSAIDPQFDSGRIRLGGFADSVKWADLWVRPGGLCEIISQGASGFEAVTGTGAPAVTDGTDGKMSIYLDTAGQRLYVINRLGAGQALRIYFERSA